MVVTKLWKSVLHSAAASVALRYMYVSIYRNAPDIIPKVCDFLPNLARIDLSSSSINAHSFSMVNQLTKLTQIEIGYECNKVVSDRSLNLLTESLCSLRGLYLYGSCRKVTNLSCLNKLRSLEHLEVITCPVDHLELDLPKLRTL